MFGRDSMRPAAVDILIGKTARIRGDIDFAGGLHLDGRVAGHVRADLDSASTLSVSDTGWIEGSAQATNVILNGTVRGDILATGHVALGPRAKVHGDVYYGVIETALGAEILGRLVPVAERRSAAQEAGAAQGPAKAGATADERGGAGEGAVAIGDVAAARKVSARVGEVTPAVGEVVSAVGEVAPRHGPDPVKPVKPAGPRQKA